MTTYFFITNLSIPKTKRACTVKCRPFLSVSYVFDFACFLFFRLLFLVSICAYRHITGRDLITDGFDVKIY